ncbi:hypothetical protein CHS0354_042840 [Potamilus streckersoni]|uniref:Membrane insertase YidC/Oxa/ALB C-terminal domain-containing protein n=1 Tax=Potamilus streckersoni TaxID=2493646 RepID=A0AAE0T602_9BIVA|nr:hypothetical protein CHS0354_042840 [Potamilus streckersoni]
MATSMCRLPLCKFIHVQRSQTAGHFRLFKIPSKCLHTRQVNRIMKNPTVLSSLTGSPCYSVYAVFAVRYNSSTTQSIPTDLPPGYIPDLPPLPDPTEFVQSLNALGEPTFRSLGLGGYFPSGILQHALEFLHVDIGLPWWGGIIAATIVVRCLMIPIAILTQRNAAKLHNHLPTMQRLQQRITNARISGNTIELARASNELMSYTKRNDIKLHRQFLTLFAQVPVFFSFFSGLRKMANLPVDSMKTGGILWFPDLTIPDPFYGLPLITFATMLAIIEIGAEGMKISEYGVLIRWIMRGLIVVVPIISSQFPAALCVYWCTSNFFSLAQVAVLKIPKVQDFCKIEQRIVHDPSSIKPYNKSFTEGFREAINNAALASKVTDRQRYNAMAFKKAGEGPIPKTYSYDPTKVEKEKVASKKSI